jgi:hypothetical protein
MASESDINTSLMDLSQNIYDISQNYDLLNITQEISAIDTSLNALLNKADILNRLLNNVKTLDMCSNSL